MEELKRKEQNQVNKAGGAKIISFQVFPLLKTENLYKQHRKSSEPWKRTTFLEIVRQMSELL